MGNAAIPSAENLTVGRLRRTVPSVLFVVAGAAIAAVIAYFIGNYFGYKTGFQAAYVPEHSHYVFEQKRAQAFESRIKDQRKCIDTRVSAIPSIDADGLQGLGEMMRNVALLERSMMECNIASGFGTPTQKQISRIIPASSN